MARTASAPAGLGLGHAAPSEETMSKHARHGPSHGLPRDNGDPMVVGAVLELLRSRSFFDGRVTRDMVQAYLESILQGDIEASCVATIAGQPHPTGINYIHFCAMLHWIAGMREISFAECVSKLLNYKDDLDSKVRVLFHWHDLEPRGGFRAGVEARRWMSMKDFTHFCETMDLFIPGRFTHGDVHLLFVKNASLFQKYGSDGYKLCSKERLMEVGGFMRSLRTVSERMNVSWKAFCRFLILKADTLGLVVK